MPLSLEGRMAVEWAMAFTFYGTAITRFLVLHRHRRKVSVGTRAGWRMNYASMCILGIMFVAVFNYSVNTWSLVQQMKWRGKGPFPVFGVPLETAITMFKTLFVLCFMYVNILWLAKASFLVVYFEVLGHLPKHMRKVVIGAGIILGVTYVALIIMMFTWCRPMKTAWDPVHYCFPMHSITLVSLSTVINICTDLMIMVIGYMVITALRLPRSAMLAASFIFALGGLTITSSCTRSALLILAIKNPGVGEQYTYNDYALLFSEVECVIAGVTACLPAFRVLLRTDPGSSNGGAKISGNNTIGSTGRKRFGKGKGGSGMGGSVLSEEDEIGLTTISQEGSRAEFPSIKESGMWEPRPRSASGRREEVGVGR